MSDIEKTSSYWVHLARKTDQERTRERAQKVQDRGDRLCQLSGLLREYRRNRASLTVMAMRPAGSLSCAT